MNTRPISSRSFPENFVTHLQTLASIRPTDSALLVVTAQDDSWVEKRLNYAALDLQARAFAALLQDRFAPGERALLMMDNDEYYVIGFLACLYAGIIAVPVFPPESIREQHLARLLAITEDAEAQCIVTVSGIVSLIGYAAIEKLSGVEILAVDTTEQHHAARWRAYMPQVDDIAFLQYTSGSTSSPKGVMVSHRNLMENARVFEEGMSIGADDIFVSWLPLYHDMGLIGGLLQPIHRGIPAILMTPKFFIERPVRWFEVISHYRATVSGAPNFAFQLCVERVKNAQLKGIDLSTWRIAFSGAEPVRRDTMLAFIERFQSAGFPEKTIYPCYGLAEATLFVTGVVRGEGMEAHEFSPELLAQGKAEVAPQGIPIVACGFPASNHSVNIVDPEKLTPLEEGYVGEVWTDGLSVASGYWQRSQETAETFLYQDGIRWLRTGDLGFIYARQLYLMGRLKDLIIIRGQNIYPQDIELVIEREVEAVRKGRIAVFSVERKEVEGIGIAVEVSRNMQKLIAAEMLVTVLSETVSASCQESLSVVVLLNPGGLPKTSSGKLQRSACHQGWCERTLDAYAIYEYGHFILGGSNPLSQPLTNEIECAVADIWEAVLNRAGLGREDNFFAIGGNSLKAIQVVARISDKWRIRFLPRNLFQHPRLGECASEVRHLLAAGTVYSTTSNQILSSDQKINALPLSYSQQRLWFLWQLDAVSSAYHIQYALRLSGVLDKHAFQASFQDLIARHESLRTIFRNSTTGTAEQVILPELMLTITDLDLQNLVVLQREEQAAEAVKRMIAIPFDLLQGPLLRVAVIRMSEHENIIVIVMHHIISDYASMQILLNELAEYYSAHVQNKASHLDNLPIRYVDYTLWQRNWMEAGEKDRQLQYWRKQLGEDHSALQFPADHARSPSGTYRAAHHDFVLPPALAAQLQCQTQDRGATLFMTLLAGFQILLYRYTGQNDIRVGVPIANRHRVEIENVVGFFVNTQVLRTQIDGRMLLSDIFDQVREAALDAQTYQDLPFEQLVEALQPERSLNQNPLFQIMFNHLREDYQALEHLPGLTVEKYELGEQGAQFELTLDTLERPDGIIEARFTYAAELFEADTIKRLGAHYLHVLEIFSTYSQRCVNDIVLLSAAEREQLKQWGVNERRYDNSEPVHRLIERQAELRPNAVALIFGDTELSYAELNTRANRLAHQLITLGISPESRVGIAVERSVEMVVGLLATLKAGGAYVPLDPDYPRERLNHMVADSAIELLLTQSHIRERIPHPEECQILELDTYDLTNCPSSNPEVVIHGENLAYIIYTSGSTGKPKGVAVAHRVLIEHAQIAADVFGLSDTDRILQFSTINFDAFIDQLFPALCSGAGVVLRGSELWDSETFYHELLDKRITIVDLTTAYWQILISDFARLGLRDYGALRQMNVGGETMPQQAIHTWNDAGLDAVTLLNVYGPTEAVVTATSSDSGSSLSENGSMFRTVAIGKPLPARNIYLLDGDLIPVIPGVSGEIYIGGDLLARGYLNNPGLTVDRFVPDPFDENGGRLYRTGDQARWRKDGQIEYLGRLDHQVKVRGFRIELSEIETQLLLQPKIREAVVVAQDGPGGIRLVAYVSLHTENTAEPAELRALLMKSLPDYMIPAMIVVLESLPMNVNGKVDRIQLPEPEFVSADQYEAPQGEVEKKLTAIWAEVLGISQVGIHSNFFDLGGHSLLLLRVKQKLEEHLSARIAIVDLFRYTTVASLAEFLSQGDVRQESLQYHRERAQRQRSALIQRKRNIERIH